MLLALLTCALFVAPPQAVDEPAPAGLDPVAGALASARSALRTGEPGRALRLLAEALAEVPGEPEIRLLLARAHNELGHGAEALAALEPALAALPGSPRLLTEKGRALAALDRAPEAEAAWREALRLYPRGGEARLRLGELLLEAGRLEEATATIEPLAAQAGDLTGVLVLRSRLLLAQGQGEAAVTLLEASLMAGGDDPSLRLALGRLHLDQGNLDAAWYAVEPLVDTERDPDTLLFVARIALQSDRVIDAVAVLGAAMLVDPTYLPVLDEIGEIFEHRHDLHVLLAARRIASDPNDARAWKEILSAHVEEGRLPLYFEALPRVPEAVRALPLLRLVEGEALRRVGRNDEARAMLTELAKGEGGAKAWYELALLDYAEGAFAAAEAGFERGAEGRYAPQARFNRGVCLDRLGRYRDAVAEYEKATALQPDFAEAWLQAGLDWRHRLGDAARARAAFAHYLELGGDDPEVRRWMKEQNR